jgi:hypothetical protein
MMNHLQTYFHFFDLEKCTHLFLGGPLPALWRVRILGPHWYPGADMSPDEIEIFGEKPLLYCQAPASTFQKKIRMKINMKIERKNKPAMTTCYYKSYIYMN